MDCSRQSFIDSLRFSHPSREASDGRDSENCFRLSRGFAGVFRRNNDALLLSLNAKLKEYHFSFSENKTSYARRSPTQSMGDEQTSNN